MSVNRVCGVFRSIQGEGKYVGYPCVFVRLSGCTRRCAFCDSDYHIDDYTEYALKEGAVKEVSAKVEKLLDGIFNIVVFTGGEPLLQSALVVEVVQRLRSGGKQAYFHLETNGDLFKKLSEAKFDFSVFDYISYSPKELSGFKDMLSTGGWFLNTSWDIKIVTDGSKVGMDLVGYALQRAPFGKVLLMPLTTGDVEKDVCIKKAVWRLCGVQALRYSPRLQVDVFGKKRGV